MTRVGEETGREMEVWQSVRGDYDRKVRGSSHVDGEEGTGACVFRTGDQAEEHGWSKQIM